MEKGKKYLYKYPYLHEPIEVVVAHIEGDAWVILEMNSKGEEIGWNKGSNTNLAGYKPIFQNSTFWSVPEDDKHVLPYPTEPVINNQYSII